MATITVETGYGMVTVTDVMVDDGYGNLNDGVDIEYADGELICEVSGYSTDDLENDINQIEDLINTYSNN